MTNWRDQAACVGLDELFFRERDIIAEKAAKNVCGGCPVRSECLDDALKFEGWLEPSGRHGVWAGLNPSQRYSLFRKQKKAEGRISDDARRPTPTARDLVAERFGAPKWWTA